MPLGSITSYYYYYYSNNTVAVKLVLCFYKSASVFQFQDHSFL